MIYFLFVSLVVVFILCYFFSGRDFFAPSTVQVLTFLGAVFMCIYFMWSLDCPHDFQWKTIGIIVGAMVMSAIIGIVVHRLFSKVDIKPYTLESVEIYPISNIVSFFVLGILFFVIFWLLIEIRRIGGNGGSFFSTMSRFHAKYMYAVTGENRFPWLLNQFITLIHPVLILYAFNLLRFWQNIRCMEKTVNITILSLCVIALLLTGMRTPVVNNLANVIVIFHLIRIQKKGGYKQYSFKFFFRIGILMLIVLATFFLTKSFVGRSSRNETLNAVDYLSYYVGAGIIALDNYLNYPPIPNNIFGKITFYSLNSFLIHYGFIDLPPYMRHVEFRPVGAGLTTNVYTFLRIYHCDFGTIGTFVLHGIMILFLSIFYEYVKKKRGNIGILTFGMMYYPVVMSFFDERFFSGIISMDFLTKLIPLLILYELLIRKRIRLKFRRAAHMMRSIPVQLESHIIDS